MTIFPVMQLLWRFASNMSYLDLLILVTMVSSQFHISVQTSCHPVQEPHFEMSDSFSSYKIKKLMLNFIKVTKDWTPLLALTLETECVQNALFSNMQCFQMCNVFFSSVYCRACQCKAKTGKFFFVFI